MIFSCVIIKKISIVFFIISIISICAGNHRVKRIVGGRPAAKPPPDDPVVFIRLYDRYSRIEGFRNSQTGIYNFLGIRYADPPIGVNRFTRPRYRRPQGNINATINGSPCPQPDPNNPQRVYGNEDCLLLNIFTPQMPNENTGLPVYVWIHPGGFRYGSAAQYGAEPIAQQGIIFVPVQYRLGTLGIMGEGSKDLSGNLAMLDMTAALRWVTEYISFFGGDPKQVKVIGHGSGAASAMYLSMSRMPRSSGAEINGVVSMSGSALSQYATDTAPVQSVQEIAAINECPFEDKLVMIKCMRKKSFEDIVLRDSEIQTERLQGRAIIKGIAGNVGFNPHVEEPDDNRGLPGFLTAKPNEIIENATFSKIPLLIGVTKHETGNGLTINTITKIWGSAEKFLKSLIANIEELKLFLRIDKNSGEILKPVLPGIGDSIIGLNELLKVPQNLSPEEILSKMTETTTDILFNLPAVLSANLWGQNAPSFLYSFEYNGAGVSNGYNFLQGLPIVSNKKNSNFTGHGDELGYLFDANDIFGNPIENAKLKSQEDLQARQNFISLLKKFSRIDLSFGFGDAGGGIDGIFTRFTGKGTPFIKVTNKLELSDNFRFCELSLWGAPIDPIQSTTCKNFFDQLNLLTNVLGGATNKVSNVLGGNNGFININRTMGGSSNNGGGLLGIGITNSAGGGLFG